MLSLGDPANALYLANVLALIGWIESEPTDWLRTFT